MWIFEASLGQQLLVCPELDKIGETACEQIGTMGLRWFMARTFLVIIFAIDTSVKE